MSEEMLPEDLFLAVLYADNQSRIKGKTRLQKIIYVISKSLKLSNFDFKPFNYGACSEEVMDLKQDLINSGYITEDCSGIRLMKSALEYAKAAWDGLDEKTRNYIDNIKRFFNELTEDELIAYTYSQWPEDASNSLILDRFKNNRVNIAINLFKKGKVSLERGAIIAGMPLRDFMKTLSERKIPIIEG